MEFLLKEGLKCEETYVGDASRYLRYLLATTSNESLNQFVEQSGKSEAYRRRLHSSLNRFLQFAKDDLDIKLELDDYEEGQEAL